MGNNLIFISLLFIITVIIIIIFFVRKGSIGVKYSFIWLGSLTILILLTLFPKLLIFLTKELNFQVASNLVFALIIGILFVVTISLTVIASKQKEQIKILVQEISLLKGRINERK